MKKTSEKRYEPLLAALVSLLIVVYVILVITSKFQIPGMLAILLAVQLGLSIPVAHRDMKEKRSAKKPALLQMVASYIAMILCVLWAVLDFYFTIVALNP